jgi:hypothetical protein
MKNIARKIAVILILVLLAGSLMGCFSMMALWKSERLPLLIFTIPLDIVTFPIQLIILLIYKAASSDPTVAQNYLAAVDDVSLAELYFTFDRIYSNFSEAEYNAMLQNLNAISDGEYRATIEKFNSLSFEQMNSLVTAFNAAPEDEIISSIKRINALGETEKLSLLQKFYSLSEEELEALVTNLTFNSQTSHALLDADNWADNPAKYHYGFNAAP